MKKIPKQLIVDYALVSVAYMVLIIAMHPIYFGEFQVTRDLIILLTYEAILSFCMAFAAEWIVTYVFRWTFSYSDDLQVRFNHFLLSGIIAILPATALLNQILVLYNFGWQHWDYAWTDYDGGFTLRWFANRLLPCIIWALGIMLIAMPIISQVRAMLISLRELKEINQLLESEQQMQHSHPTKDNVTDKIIIEGNNRESLIVNPLDIMYVESVGNYLNIVYFNDSELCQKRLRSSLKDIEETLDSFPYMVHTHRAFLVNINFITQVFGNSAGYKISMFSTDKVLPVSKANVTSFRERIKELGKELA
ncbi:MAG: LytTR family transcriptional regulator [Bacteroidaceae bacterium]|nr:LytTR family transcriptional regulator [Bacteroidaceae bacterium]